MKRKDTMFLFQLFFCLFFPSQIAKAQSAQDVHILRTDEQGIIQHAEVRVPVSEQSVGEFLRRIYHFNKDHTLVEKSRITIGNELHIRYQHKSAAYPVFGSELIAHLTDGLLKSFNGHIYMPEAGVNPTLQEEEALEIALGSMNAETYMWQIKDEEFMLKYLLNDQSATYYPKGELIYVPKAFNFDTKPELCYRFQIYSSEPLARKAIYVHAGTAELWAEEDLLHIGDAKGSANTRYRGVKPLVTDSLNPNTFRLRESGRGGGIETYDMNQGTSYAASTDFFDTDNYWNNYNATFDEVAGDAHFGAEATYDYYLETFNRNSFDNNGAKIRSYVHYRNGYSNAFWNGLVMTYGDGNGSNYTPLTSLDVCGHEISHAVTSNSANLVYSYESGALNESFSDIFGNSIEYYADSLQFSWRIGEDVTISGNGLRNMANPKTHGDPSTYQGQYWYSGTGDNGGVHTNSGVQNFWYYLLCEGGSGINDNGDAYTVDSIGIHKAQQVAYRNLVVYLSPTSQYEDARYYAIRAAGDIFGPCSKEVEIVSNAWYAVGVGFPYDSSAVRADFSADSMLCQTTDGVQFNQMSVNAGTFKWFFGDGDSSALSDPYHSYAAQGVYSVRLIVESCFHGFYDTLYKPDYIVIDSTRDICNAVLMPAGSSEVVQTCKTFIYDHGGEDFYNDRLRDTLTLVYANADSAYLTFLEFSYETDWDSIYIYDGYSTSSALLGGFTGNSLPGGGKPFKLTSGAVTITHFSDQFVVDNGFKAYLEAFRPALTLKKSANGTACVGQTVRLWAKGSGGDSSDHYYKWNGLPGDSTFTLTVVKDTVVYLEFGDRCTGEFVVDSIFISVRDSLRLKPVSNLTLCYLEEKQIHAEAKGGDSTGYTFTWLPYGIQADSISIIASSDTTILLVVNDQCSSDPDSLAFLIEVRDPINIQYKRDTLLCQGDSVNLLLSASGGLDSFSLQHENGNVIDGKTTFIRKIVPPGTGSFHYWTYVTDHCTQTRDTAFYSVQVRDSLKLSVSGDTTVCFGTEANLQAFGSGGLGTYTFVWNDGLANQSAQLVKPGKSAVYTVQLADGCSSYEPIASINVSVLDSISVSISAPDTSCYKEQFSLRAKVSGGNGNYNYTWDQGKGTDSVYSTSLLQDHVFELSVGDGCTVPSSLATYQVRVREPLRIMANWDSAICMGESAVMDVQGSGGLPSAYTFRWEPEHSSDRHRVVQPQFSQLYTIYLTDECSEEVHMNLWIEVHPLPIVTFDMAPDPWCIGDSVQFTYEGNLGEKFSWDFGDQESSKRKDPAHLYAASGTFRITLLAETDFGCIDSASRSLVIYERPLADFNFSPEEGSFLEPEFSFQNTSQFANNFFWQFGTGAVDTTPDPVYRYYDTGSYQVSLVAGNDAGCSDTVIKTLRVNESVILWIPNAFSPNGDQVDDEYGIYARGLTEFNMIIYNRWGQIVWVTDDPEDRWDGMYSGIPAPVSYYLYVIKARDVNGEELKRSGVLYIYLTE